ncbi:MAG TPA: LysM peptidoglycan-binding domain-containing protein [Firmicutes bacterium]|jgi:N-acetylmuramoyl-L-alanine amidase|nr:LysM peptidoglycan-binding domain-containing protein [Bacillota bacterium]
MRVFVMALAAVLLVAGVSCAGGTRTYVVKPGDTLSHIALEFGLPWREIASYNKITDPTKLQIGTVLHIPNERPHTISLADGSVYVVSGQDEELMARLVYAEARGEPLEGQIAVAAVVLNRLRSSKFPNTISEVIYDPGQFTPVESNSLPTRVDDRCREAVRRALQGEDPTGGALFFYNPDTARNPGYWKTRPVLKQIGNHNFTL